MRTALLTLWILVVMLVTQAFAQTAPTDVKIIGGGVTFGVAWDYTEPVLGFRIYSRVLNTQGWNLLTTVTGSAMANGEVIAYNVPQPAPGTHELMVTAFNDGAGVESSESNIVRFVVLEPPSPTPCTYIPAGAVEAETRPVGYLLIGRIIYDNADGNSKTNAARRVEQFKKWGWLLSPWPEIDPADGKHVLRVRAWCKVVPGLE